MNIILKKVNKFEDIKERSLYAVTNVDNTEYAIATGNLVSFLTYKAIKKTKDEATLQVVGNNTVSVISDIILTETSFKSLNIHKVELSSEKESKKEENSFMVTYQGRKIRKLEKQNRALRAILKKNGINTTQETQRLNSFINKLVKNRKDNPTVMTDKLTENIFGYEANIIVGTNYVDEVEICIYIDKNQNIIGSKKLLKSISVSGKAKLHPEDDFCYNTGVQLALMRAKLKLMEELVK